MNEQIVILDFGSQYTQVIARRVRECNVYSSILRYDTTAKEIAALKPSGLILSGGPASVYAQDAPLPDKNIFKLGVPVLGICYGVQILAHFLGGKVEPGQKREYGKGTLTVRDNSCPLFQGLPDTLQVWNSHGDKLTRLPRGFVSVATSDNSDYAAIENRALHCYGQQFHPEVVHTPRAREAEVVREVFGRNFRIRLQYEDASKLFLSRLKGVTDPERKRKIIGKTFIEVFQAATQRAGKAKFLAQGTLYPDVIESVPIAGNPAAMIKSHHNVGGLPKNLRFKLVEPLKRLFKDEVRLLGLELRLPKEIVHRQPFPGPGLGVRILGEVTADRLEILRNADAIVVAEMKASDWYYKVWQSFAVLLPV